MNTIASLLVSTALPVLATAAFYWAEKKTTFQQLNYRLRQTIIGLVFAGIAIYGTENGIPITGAVINVRDAAPLCAGLLFGAPAGIIAGVIGGLERWVAVAWGVGSFTRVACSFSTAFSGIFAAWIRVKVMENERPNWKYALAIGLEMEVLHMLSVFMTNINQVSKAFDVVKACAGPMISLNALSVMLASLVVMEKKSGKETEAPKKRDISTLVQRNLLVLIVIAFLATTIFTYVLQTNLTSADEQTLFELNIQDVCADIEKATGDNLMDHTRLIADELKELPEINSEILDELLDKYSVQEINVIYNYGLIRYSTNPAYIAYKLEIGQGREFMNHVNEYGETVEQYQPISYDKSVYMKYAGITLDDYHVLQVGYTAEGFQQSLQETVQGITENRHIGENGFLVVADKNKTIVSARDETMVGQQLPIDVDALEEQTIQTQEVDGEDYFCEYKMSEGFYIVAAQTCTEANGSRDISVYISALMQAVTFGSLFVLLYFVIESLVVNNVKKMNQQLGQITSGDLDVIVDVHGNREFSMLSDGINDTVTKLKDILVESEIRMAQELKFASTVQNSAMPAVFPSYPDAANFDLYALFAPAKIVGGDFYDFFYIGQNKLAVVMADVSGKGVPAAMFMMTAKTNIKNLAESGLPVDEVLTQANKNLCEGNEAEMFVTVWIGIIDLKSGEVTYANAGHNPPLLMQKNGEWNYLQPRPGLVLAGMDGYVYKSYSLKMNEGDRLYLYTDGITEATTEDNELFGEARLQSLLNENKAKTSQELCELVKSSVDAFVGEAPQFDDMTMLSIRYLGNKK